MATKNLQAFYSYKEASFELIDPPDAASAEVEERVRAHLFTGNAAFFQGRYSAALTHYFAALGLIAQLVHPRFPYWVASIAADRLAQIDLTSTLAGTGAAILKYRNAVGPGVPIVGPIDPPPTLVELADRFGKHLSPAQQLYEMALASARMGDHEQVTRRAKKALGAAGDDPELQAHVFTVLAASQLARGDAHGAEDTLGRADEAYARAKRPEGRGAVQHNLGVARLLAGDVQGGSALFAAAAVGAPATGDWQATHTTNPGIASVSRPMGRAGLGVLVSDSAGAWSKIPSVTVSPADRAFVVRAGAGVEIDLTGNGAAALTAALLQPRVHATTLAELALHLIQPHQLSAYLAHVNGFVLPMALGDTFFALRDFANAVTWYSKARDYPFLNLAIERPVVWSKLAQTFLQWGTRLYRDRDMAGARDRYEQIIKITDAGFDASGPLYTGAFAGLRQETLDFVANPNAPTTIDFGRRIILLEALAYLRQILHNINYLGFPDDIIPIHSWRYLQNVARFFAAQAVQAERAYITFKENSEKETFTRLTLEQAVDAQQAAVSVENQRVRVAQEQQRVAQLTAGVAALREQNAKDQRADFANTSAQEAYIDEILSFTNSSDREVKLDQNWASALGIELKKVTVNILGDTQELTLDTFKGNYLSQLLTRNRSHISRGYELRTMDRKIAEVAGERAIADAQVDVADRMVDVAQAQRNLAELRLDQAREQLTFFNAQEFTPELWDNLAQAQRSLSRRYLDWAIGAAFLMEQAFEDEFDLQVNRIRFDYDQSALHGLLAADFLIADIDQFTYDRLLDTEKRAPIKVAIALADRYPHEFYQQFQRTGRMDVQTTLEDFDIWHPGTFLRKLRRVEVIVEGLVSPSGLHGTLTNNGISVDRGREGQPMRRIRNPETMILSRFDPRADGFAFTADEETVLATFENAGVATGWVLEFPPDANDVDLTGITNVHLVLYFEAYYRYDVANRVRAELAAAGVYQYALGVGVRFQYPDEFFSLQDTGTLTFTIDEAALPHNHTAPLARDLFIRLEVEGGVPAGGLTVGVSGTTSGTTVQQVTDADGLIGTSDGAAPLNAFRTHGLLDTWTIKIDRVANEAAFATGFTWEKIRNVYLFAEYDYTPRGRPATGGPFTTDPLATFEIVDDARALDGPSAWSFDPVGHAVTQTSPIAGPTSPPPADNGPDKPGAYLVGRAANWPALRDLVLRCRLATDVAGAIGVVFRYVDADNFYFFLMDVARGYRRLGKKVAGTFRELDVSAFDAAHGFDITHEHVLTIAAVNDAITVLLDDEEILNGRDGSINKPGRVGLYAYDNKAARFLELLVRPV
jgi:hypothetical protein